MKSLFFSLLALCALPLMAGIASSPKRIQLKDGAVLPLESGKLICDFSVKPQNNDWGKFENYEDKLTYAFDSLDDVPVLMIKNATGGGGDTAWCIQSKEIILTSPVKRMLVEVECRATVGLQIPNNSTYWYNRVIWYNKEKKEIKSSAFTYQGSSEGFVLTQIPVMVPAGAASFRIQFGADNPNIGGKQYIAFKSVQVLAADSAEDPAKPSQKTGKALYALNLTPKSTDWEKFENYDDKLVYSFTSLDDTPVLLLKSAKEDGGDTAWNLISRDISIKTTAQKLLLEIECRATVNPDYPSPSTYWYNRIIWYNKEKKEIKSSAFTYQGSSEGFVLTQIPVMVPAGAASFRIQFGADNPNIGGKNFIAYKTIRLVEETPKNTLPQEDTSAIPFNYLGKNSFVSQTFSVSSGKIYWTGTFPQGSSGNLQLSWAPDAYGAPGKWSEFIGPDGTEKTFYRNNSQLQNIPAAARYLRYRFSFIYQKQRPTLLSVVVGSFRDYEWNTFFSKSAPIVVNLTPPVRDFCKPIIAKIVPSTLLNWDSLKFSIDDQDVTRSVVIEGNTVRYIPKTPFSDNLHTFTITIADMEGNKTTAKRYFDFAAMPDSNVITLRDDGIILIDEKPFFPIGIYSMAKKPWNNYSFDQGVKQLKEAGFNLTHNYNSTRDNNFCNEFMGAIRKYGLKVFIAGPNGANSHDLEPFIRTVRQEKSNPDILAWYIADDASGYWSPDELTEMSDAVRAADPSRPTAQADGASGYDNFANATSIFLPEIYPVYGENAADDAKCVSMIIRDIDHSFSRIALEGRPMVPVWATIQYFHGWGNKRYPTPRELRAMSYAAIIHGAQGIIWYTYAPGDHVKNKGAASTPESWQVISSLTRELNEIYPVLCERKAPEQPGIAILSGPEKDALNFPSISGLLKIHDGKSYYFAVNSSTQPVTAAVDFPKAKSARVLFENRSIPITDGKLTDTFAAQDVHVYEIQ